MSTRPLVVRISVLFFVLPLLGIVAGAREASEAQTSTGVGAHATSDAQTTIDAVAATLARLGDASLGKRLQADFAAGKVVFGATERNDMAHVRAGWFGYGGPDTNWMTIRRDQERAGRVSPTRRWNPNGSGALVPLASNMVHEYVHMGQAQPRNEPKWEDPAYREQEAAVGRWIRRLSAEIDAFEKQPAGAARAGGLRETTDLLRAIRSDCGTMVGPEGALALAAITKGRSWQYENYIRAIDQQLRRVEGLDPTVAADWLGNRPARPAVPVTTPVPGAPSGVIPRTGAWVLSSSDVWSDNPGIDQAAQEYASGPAQVRGSIMPGVTRFSWINPHREGAPKTSLAVTWSVPDMVPPSGEFIIKATAADTGSSAGAGEGDFVSFAVGLYGSDDGTNWRLQPGNFPSLSASPGKTVSETYRVPAPAAKVAFLQLHVSTGNIHWGKIVRYHYRWKDGPR